MERHQIALEKLRKFIADIEPAKEEQLPPERELANQFGVGRRSLRRALDVLEDEGLIWRRQGAGTFVNGPPSVVTSLPRDGLLNRIAAHTNPVEIMEARLIVEPAITHLAALRASPSEIESLGRLAGKSRTAQTPDEYEQADLAFHRRIAKVARNELLLSIFDLLDRARRTAAAEAYGERPHCIKRRGVYAKTHEDIVAAISMRDGAAAERLMFEHLRDVQEHFLDTASPGRRLVPAFAAGPA